MNTTTLIGILYNPTGPTAILTLVHGKLTYGKVVSLSTATDCCNQAISQGFKPHLRNTISGMWDVTFRHKQ